MKISISEIRYLRSFLQKKRREEESKFLLEGWRPLRDALESRYHIEMIAVAPSAGKKSDYQKLLALAGKHGVPVKELTDVQMEKISDTIHSQGVVALIHQKTKHLQDALLRSEDLIVACDRINDPGNMGTILRTCDWFGVHVVLLSEGCVSLYNEKVIRATAGSIFHLDVFEHVNLDQVCNDLRLQGFSLVATAMKGESLHEFSWSGKSCLILGSEAQGVQPELIQKAIKVLNIPRFGKAESLNVGVACGIILDHWRESLTRRPADGVYR